MKISHYRSSRPHSRGPWRPELTGEWNIPIAWEPQTASKAPRGCVALNTFDSSSIPLPLLWGLIIVGLLREHRKFPDLFCQDLFEHGI